MLFCMVNAIFAFSSNEIFGDVSLSDHEVGNRVLDEICRLA